MAIIALEDLPRTGPLLGLDPGSKTIGLAACDAGRLVASPVETLQKGRKLGPVLERLMAIYDQRRAVGIVLGLPLNMDGSEGPSAQSARALAWNILRVRDIPIALHDERLSSAQAERALLEWDVSRARRAELIDANAAAIILQSAIDRLANIR